MEERIQIRDPDVYAVADKGDEELKRGSTELSQAALDANGMETLAVHRR